MTATADTATERNAEDAAMYDALAELLPDARPVILAKLTTMLAGTKNARASRRCAKCGCQHVDTVEVDDSSAAERVLRLVWEYGKGKPRAMEAADNGPQVVIQRAVGGRDTTAAEAAGSGAHAASSDDRASAPARGLATA